MNNLNQRVNVKNFDSLLDFLDDLEIDSELDSGSLDLIKMVLRKAVKNISEMTSQLESTVYNKTDQTEKTIVEIKRRLEELKEEFEQEQVNETTDIASTSQKFDEFNNFRIESVTKFTELSKDFTHLRYDFKNQVSSITKNLENFNNGITKLDTKVDKVSNDVSKIKGQLSISFIGLVTSIITILGGIFAIYMRLPYPH